MSAFELNNEDVLLMYTSESFTKDRTSRAGDMLEDVKDFFYSCNLPHKGWIDGGVECEVLQTSGGGWQKGKVKLSIRIEFVPDEPEVLQQSASIVPGEPMPQLDTE